MSAVFGITSVIKTEDLKTSDNKRFKIFCKNDNGEEDTFYCPINLPINSKIYWEFDCRTGKGFIQPIRQ